MNCATNRSNKKTPSSKPCTAETCSRAARLEVLLTENKFLGQCVDSLQEALQMSDHHRQEREQQIDDLKQIIQELELHKGQHIEHLQVAKQSEDQLIEALAQCRQLRDDKTQLIQQLWMSLEHIARIRQRNHQLEKQLHGLHEQFDRDEKLENQEGMNALVLQRGDGDEDQQLQQNNNEIDAIRQQIEMLEKRALSSQRLQQELNVSKHRCDSLQQRLDECTIQYDQAKEQLLLYIEREAVLLEQLMREMASNSRV